MIASQISDTVILHNDFRAQWQDLRDKALAAVDRVGQSGWLILGQEVKQFEEKLAAYWHIPYAVGCGNGLDALEIALRCLNLPQGGRVLTTPLSAFATTLAILRAGGVPVFVDVDESGLVDLELCDKVLTQYPDIRYFVPVHLYGHALPLGRLATLKDKFQLSIVEDCAQAIGAKSGQTNVGTVGDIAITSFYPTKNLGCLGDGGALLTANQKHYEFAKSLRDYGQTKKYIHEELGLNSRLDELQAAILHDALLPQLNHSTLRRKAIAREYCNKIKHPLLKLPHIPAASDSVWHLFPVLVTANREAFQKYLLEMKIHTNIHYPELISNQAVLKKHKVPYLEATELRHAKYFAEHEVSLPLHPYLTDNEVERVIDVCNNWQG